MYIDLQYENPMSLILWKLLDELISKPKLDRSDDAIIDEMPTRWGCMASYM